MRKSNKNKRPSADKQPEPLSDVWYTTEQLKQLFEISISSINRWRKAGLVYSKPTGRIRYNKTDVQAFLVKHRKTKMDDNNSDGQDG